MGSRTKDVIKWSKQVTSSQVIQLMRAEKDINKAQTLFDLATAEYANGFRHDHGTFSLMISKLVSSNQFRSAEGLLDRMKEENCKANEEIFLSICRGYGRVHRPLDSVRIFHKMKEFECQQTPKGYVTVFAILVEENHLKLALRFYKSMRQMGVPPCVTSLNVLIKALCKSDETIDSAIKIFRDMPNHGLSPDSYTYGTLINGLCKLGKIDEAKELFNAMETNNCSPSVVTYTSLINGLCQQKNVDQAMELFEDMKRKDIQPNVFTYICLMDGLCKNGQSSKALEMLNMMVKKRQMPNTISYSTLISGLCKEKKAGEAVELLDRMKLQGLKPDAALYGKIITVFCDIGKFREVSNFLDEMVLGGISPNRMTWSLHVRINNTVVQGLCTMSDVNRAFQLYASMRNRGISVNSETFDSLVKCFVKKGDLHKADKIFNEMVLDGCIPDEGTWSVVVGGFSDQSKVMETAELLKDVTEPGITFQNQSL